MPNEYSGRKNEDKLPTPYEYSLMCNSLYFNGDPSRDANIPDIAKFNNKWQIDEIVEFNGKSYWGIAYRSATPDTNVVVIVHRGTDTDWPFANIISGLSLTINCGIPTSYQHAKNFSQTVRERFTPQYKFIETGHSLGGIYAQLNGAEFEDKTLEIVSFDNPGCEELFKK